MTLEEVKEMLPIIQAFAEGKTIEFFNHEGKWQEVVDAEFAYATSRYRIKPEPKYRPFKDKKECWNEMKRHEPFGWVIREGNFQNIMAVDSTYIYIETLHTYFPFKEALAEYTFADGTPFGIREG